MNNSIKMLRYYDSGMAYIRKDSKIEKKTKNT